MAYKLTINVGGLCMLVQKKTSPQGLYVLMPASHHEHCPVMITEAANTPGGKALLVPIGEDQDLTYLAAHATKLQPRPPKVLEMSMYAGQPVNAGCFAGPRLNCLARVVRLPLGCTMTPADPVASLNVPDANGVYAPQDFVGTVAIGIDVQDLDVLVIAGKRLTPIVPVDPKSPATMTITILHVPRAEWECVEEGIAVGSPATHLDAYYDLLGDNCATPPNPRKPAITHATKHDGKAGNPSGKGCPTKDEPAPKKCATRLLWIQPANCTVGYGCETLPCP